MIPLRKAHQDFVENLKEKNRAHATVLAYGKDIDQLVEFLQELERAHVHEVTKEDIEAFLAKLTREGYTPKSVSRKINATKTFFRFLKISEYVTDDPAALISHPKFEPKQPRILTETEYRALRDATRNDTRTYAVVELLLQTGVRIGELARLHVEDVKFGEKEGSLGIASFNRHAERGIPLNATAQKALRSYLAERPKTSDHHLFVTRTGKPFLVRNIRATLKRYFDVAGIPDATVNDLRHTFIAHHLKKGASLVLVSKIAGHKRVSTTEKYLEVIQAGKGLEKMELSEL